MSTYPVRYRLPTAYCTEIGRIVTRFALVESLIRRCSYTLLGISPKQGRVAVRLGRIEDSLTALEDLVGLAGINVKTNIGNFKKPLKELEGWRDKLSHGIWVRHSETSDPVLQVTAGTYQVSNTNLKAKARLEPRAAHLPLETLRTFAKQLEGARRAIDGLSREIAHALSRQKPSRSQRPPSRGAQKRHPVKKAK